MTVSWFGRPWPSEEYRAPVCEDDQLRIPIPIGESCLLCDEPFDADSRGESTVAVDRDDNGSLIARPAYVHIECSFRQVMGGPAHVRGSCSCQGGADDPDLGMTPRAAAVWVWNHYQRPQASI